MIWLGWLLAFTVSVAAISLAARRAQGLGDQVGGRRPAGGLADLAIATLLCWLVLFSAGYALPRAAGAGELVALATGVLLGLVVLLACATLGTRVRDFARRFWATLKSLATLPLASGAVTLRSLSVSLLGLLLSLVVLWTLFRGGDTTVVTVLGLAPRRPLNPATLANEPFARLLRPIAALLLLTSGYALTRRQGADQVAALGFGCVLLLTPGVLHSLRGAGPAPFALILGALALAAKPDLKPFDAVLAYAALGIAASQHAWGWLEAAPAAVAVALFSLTARERIGIVRALAMVGGGVVLLVLAGIFSHSLRPGGLGVAWPIQKLALFFEAPPPGDPLGAGQGLGLGFAWATLPLAALGVLLVVVECGARLARRVARVDSVVSAPWPTLVVVLAAFLPACFQATPYLPLAASAIVLAAWFCARLSAPRIAEAAIAINMLAIVSFHWWYAW